MKVKFLLVLNDDPWATNYYRCGHCTAPVAADSLERHARDMHGIDLIEVHNDGSALRG